MIKKLPEWVAQAKAGDELAKLTPAQRRELLAKENGQ
jgi:hypothetical protein